MNLSGEVYRNESASMRLIGNQCCPGEAEILAYSENLLSGRRRSRVERHMVECDDCREVLALLAQGELVTDVELLEESPEDVRIQTAAVLEMIAQDERRRALGRPRGVLDWVSSLAAFRPQVAAMAAALFLLMLAGVYFFWPRDSATDAVMETLAKAVATDGRRRTDVRLSVELPYYPYEVTRGSEDSGSIYFDHALNQLKRSEPESEADSEFLMARAQVLLTRAAYSDAQDALRILEELVSKGVNSPAVFNDLGVAKYELGDYEGAIEAFSEALARSPDMEKALFNRGIARKHLSRQRQGDLRAQLSRESRADLERFMMLEVDERWKKDAARHFSDVAAEPER